MPNLSDLRDLRDLRGDDPRGLRGPTRTQQLGLIIVLAAVAVYVLFRAY
jgi:hypothetical protein